MAFLGLLTDGGGAKKAPPLKSVSHISYNDETWQLYLTQRRSKKYMSYVTYSLSSADISIFSPGIDKFSYIKKYRYRLHFNTLFLFILTFLESLQIVIINMVNILIMCANMVTPSLLKIMVVWNKGYCIIYSVYDVTNKNLSHNANYIVDVIMWPKFGNSSICTREVIITSII